MANVLPEMDIRTQFGNMTRRSIASIMNIFQGVSSMPAEPEPSESLHSSKVLQMLHPLASLPTLREKL